MDKVTRRRMVDDHTKKKMDKVDGTKLGFVSEDRTGQEKRREAGIDCSETNCGTAVETRQSRDVAKAGTDVTK